MSTVIDELTERRDQILASLDDTANRIAALPPDAPSEEREVLEQIFERDNEAAKRLTADIRRRETIAEQRAELKPQQTDDPEGKRHRIAVGKEPLTYRKPAEGGRHSFFRDQLDASKGDLGAQQRLQQHMAEMRVEMRDLTTTDGSGGEFVPPLWLQERWIGLPRAGRVTANVVANEPLPETGEGVSLPKLSTGAAVAIQTSENSGVQETDPAATSVTAGVKTIAGQVDMSRQLFDRSRPGMDQIIMRDLVRDYDTKLDIQVISGSGSSGQALGVRSVSGINTVTYTDGTPTVGELYPKVADAVQRIASGIFSYPDAIVMHPRRWGMMLGAVDTAGRPLVNATAEQNSVAGGVSSVAEGRVGTMQGLPVYVDANIPTNVGSNTNEDVILVLSSEDLILFENGTPSTRVFESVGSGTLTIRISLWNYFAFMSARLPAGISVITGTGLVAPTF